MSTTFMDWISVGSGTPLWDGEPLVGVAYEVNTAKDVLRLMTDTPADMILFSRSASATIFAPLLADAIGVLCTSGTVGSHLAILAREFDLPCIMAADIPYDRVVGRKVKLLPSGHVQVVRE
jgi:signal transduction protein with GAF and PtsI domain